MNTKTENADLVSKSEARSPKSEVHDGVTGTAAGSISAEQWWTRHAELLAVKMKHGGVERFCIERTPRGTYAFEVTPV